MKAHPSCLPMCSLCLHHIPVVLNLLLASLTEIDCVLFMYDDSCIPYSVGEAPHNLSQVASCVQILVADDDSRQNLHPGHPGHTIDLDLDSNLKSDDCTSDLNRAALGLIDGLSELMRMDLSM